MVEIIVLQKTSCAKIGINTYDLHLNEPLKFLTLEIIIKCASKEGKKLFLQIYLNQYPQLWNLPVTGFEFAFLKVPWIKSRLP